MSEWTRDECESCHAPIIWAVTTRAKRMPVDFEPSGNGNISLQQVGLAPLAVVLSVAKQFGRKDLRTSHFVTCPDAKAWRSKARSVTP